MKNYWIEQKMDQLMLDKTKGFPSDDANALQQLADGNYLDLYHEWQFVQNEEPNIVYEHFGATIYQFNYFPIGAGTMYGTIYFNNEACFTFFVKQTGEFEFKKIITKNSENFEVYYNSELSLNTGKLRLNWGNEGITLPPKLVVSYEYNYSENYNRGKMSITRC